jgi:hypothetical protein
MPSPCTFGKDCLPIAEACTDQPPTAAGALFRPFLCMIAAKTTLLSTSDGRPWVARQTALSSTVRPTRANIAWALGDSRRRAVPPLPVVRAGHRPWVPRVWLADVPENIRTRRADHTLPKERESPEPSPSITHSLTGDRSSSLFKLPRQLSAVKASVCL